MFNFDGKPQKLFPIDDDIQSGLVDIDGVGEGYLLTNKITDRLLGVLQAATCMVLSEAEEDWELYWGRALAGFTLALMQHKPDHESDTMQSTFALVEMIGDIPDVFKELGREYAAEVSEDTKSKAATLKMIREVVNKIRKDKASGELVDEAEEEVLGAINKILRDD